MTRVTSHHRSLVAASVILFAFSACGERTAEPAVAETDTVPAAAEDDGASDHSAVAATVERFHAALQAGDSTAVVGLLESDAVIVEAGGVEGVDDYRRGHLTADIAFARSVEPRREVSRVTVEGDVAWAVSQSVAEGEFQGRNVASQGAELMVLNRRSDGWRIAAIHWSSRSLPQ